MPPPDRWFEDFRPGEVEEFGACEVTQAAILAYAAEFDPQPFHTDPEAAKTSIYGGLIASGWHTVGIMMRLLVDHYIPRNASLGSPGVDELRWLAPVRPGDRLRVRVAVQEALPSRSRPDRGSVRSLMETLNQRDEVVMTVRGTLLFRRRPATGG